MFGILLVLNLMLLAMRQGFRLKKSRHRLVCDKVGKDGRVSQVATVNRLEEKYSD